MNGAKTAVAKYIGDDVVCGVARLLAGRLAAKNGAPLATAELVARAKGPPFGPTDASVVALVPRVEKALLELGLAQKRRRRFGTRWVRDLVPSTPKPTNREILAALEAEGAFNGRGAVYFRDVPTLNSLVLLGYSGGWAQGAFDRAHRLRPDYLAGEARINFGEAT